MNEYHLVSELILGVLTSKITVLDALSRFPKNDSDINLKCAFDAIAHYEADEDLRKNEPDYAIVQDEYLEHIAQTLAKGEQLSKNIIDEY
ncbi:hypothetical protein IJ531_03930, partial [bacterium]|nr:hypothetical protein [bacterium]